jgi:pantoate--beta-alanine ligase
MAVSGPIGEVEAKGSDPAGLTPAHWSEVLARLCDTARREILAAGFARVDYVAVRDAATLREPDPASNRPLRVLAAAWLGKTRLIDNVGVR